MSPIMLVCAGIVILGLGLGCGYWFAQSQRKREANRADGVQKELDEYRRHVTEHFGQTAQHFQALGQQYQSLYKHMAKGADALCDPAQSGALLEFPAVEAAALTSDNERSESSPQPEPETIRDYAVEEEIEPEKIIRDYALAEEDNDTQHADIDPVITAEPTEDLAMSENESADSSIEDAITEPVATPPDVEKERTVH